MPLLTVTQLTLRVPQLTLGVKQLTLWVPQFTLGVKQLTLGVVRCGHVLPVQNRANEAPCIPISVVTPADHGHQSSDLPPRPRNRKNAAQCTRSLSGNASLRITFNVIDTRDYTDVLACEFDQKCNVREYIHDVPYRKKDFDNNFFVVRIHTIQIVHVQYTAYVSV